ncbi:MAG: AAA family ATPase [Bacteroidales bacterium]|nr:AAA family ATPase [Candidatus Cryptobacteroides caccocaballi]
MKRIKDSLRYDYNQVVRCFNEKDSIGFFRNVRPMIERLSKLIIFDMLGDEDKASGLISGTLAIEKASNGLFEIKKNLGRKPQGKAYPLMVPKVFAYKHPEIVGERKNDEKKRIKRGVDSCCSEWARFYDIASGIAMHTDHNPLNTDIQAAAVTSFFMGFIDFLQSFSLISKDVIDYLNSLDRFDNSNKAVVDESRAEIAKLISELETRQAAVMEANAMKLKAEKERLEAEGINTELSGKISDMQATIDELLSQVKELKASNGINHEEDSDPENNGAYQSIKPRAKIIDILRKTESSWDVKEESMDDDQLDIIDMNISKSMLVTGCAGSGKSVIAMHKAEQIAKTGASVILIAYTRSLSAFMREGIEKETLPYRFCHHYQWKNKLNMMAADYIIVDEIQDFTEEEIREFMAAARKAFFFFGDSAQSIYKLYGKNTISIEQISTLTELRPLQLYNNYRLPRNVAKITQDYVGVNVNKYEEKIYQNKSKSLPHIVKIDTYEGQVDAIAKLVDEFYTDLFDKRDIGILVPTNDMVMSIQGAMESKGIPCEFKYSDEKGGAFQYVDTLDFNTSMPKIMTYHSAKGLQFDVVILPLYEGAFDEESRKALYVAMTRTMNELYILYSSDNPATPLDKVPSRLFLKTL